MVRLRGKVVRVSPNFAKIVWEESQNTGLECTVLTDVLAVRIAQNGGTILGLKPDDKKVGVGVKKKVKGKTWELIGDF